MLSVVDQARNIFGCFTKKQPARQGSYSGSSRTSTSSRCGNTTRSGSALGNRQQPLTAVQCGLSKADPSSSSGAVGVGARFGKYYLEMMENLDQNAVTAPVNPEQMRLEQANAAALNQLRSKSFSRIKSLDLRVY